MDIDNLKYSELQKLAKSAGIRANQKIDKLVKALKDYHGSHADGTCSVLKSNDCDSKQNPEHIVTDEVTNENMINPKMSVRGMKKGHKKGKKRKNKEDTMQNKNAADTVKQQSTGTPKILRAKPLYKTGPAIVNPASDVTPLTKKKTPNAISASKTPVMKKIPVVNPSSTNSTPQAEKGSKESRKSPRSSGAKSMKGNITRDARKSSLTTNVDAAITAESGSLKQKRNSTFDLEEATLGVQATPEVEKTTRKSLLTETPFIQNVPSKSSPGIQDMLDSMTGVKNSAERRKRLMSVIDKKIETKVKPSPHAGPATQIPRFVAFLAKRKQEQKKTITPGNKDWEKVHKKEFSKFDSIDVYLEKKRKRAEEITASVKKARTVLHEVQEAVTKLRGKRTPSLGKKNSTQSFKPSVFSTKNMNFNFGTADSCSKTPNNRKSGAALKPFKPTVTSTKDMNINFSSIKTPVTSQRRQYSPTSNSDALSARKSVGASQKSSRKSLGPAGASAAAARKSTGNTPFCFTGNLNMSDARSVSKPVFDLKASLARPITWKPHVGKLKPVDTLYSKPASVNRMDIFKSAVNKTCITYSRQDRRAAAAAKRSEKKDNQQMKRRGIAAMS